MLIDLIKKNAAVMEQPNQWYKCKKCGATVGVKDVRANWYACPECGAYVRIHAYRRIRLLTDEGSFTEWDHDMEAVNPLDFPGYEEKIRETRAATELNEAVVTGRALIEGNPCAIGVCDARYMMSSMGHNMGEKIARMAERAAEEKLPVILYACSGGARMQEGIISLMQMVKTSEALGKLKESGQLFISVLTDPTMGGVSASFAMLGDIILAEPKALIGFTGARVIQQTIGGTLPEGFQRAEFQLQHGFVDAIVERKNQRAVLAKILRLHRAPQVLSKDAAKTSGISDMIRSVGSGGIGAAGAAATAGVRVTSRAVTAVKNAVFGKTAAFGKKTGAAETGEETLFAAASAPENEARAAGDVPAEQRKTRSAWETVKISRAKDRAHAEDYIYALFPDFTELHGDRCFGDDGAVIGGIASLDGTPVTVIGIQKGRTFADNKVRNFGMPNPEGYRKALRLMKQAERFHRPVVTIVDTPGAYCGIGAEERGQGEAIARNLQELSFLKTPILTLVIGEGSSGGALALATSNEVWMMENAVYSILSPEGFAAILYKDAKKHEEAAEEMKMTSADLLKLGVIEKVIPESEPATAERIGAVCEGLKPEILSFIRKYAAMSGEELCENRYRRYRKF